MIRASEAAAENQMAAASHAASGSVSFVPNVSKRKCYHCGKPGYEAKNCPSRKNPNPKGQTIKLKCGFCGGPKRCQYKECKAYDVRCASSKKFGHLQKCYNDVTRAKARKNKDSKVVKAAYEEKEDRIQSLSAIRLSQTSNKKEEKKSRQHAKRDILKYNSKVEKDSKVKDNNVDSKSKV